MIRPWLNFTITLPPGPSGSTGRPSVSISDWVRQSSEFRLCLKFGNTLSVFRAPSTCTALRFEDVKPLGKKKQMVTYDEKGIIMKLFCVCRKQSIPWDYNGKWLPGPQGSPHGSSNWWPWKGKRIFVLNCSVNLKQRSDMSTLKKNNRAYYLCSASQFWLCDGDQGEKICKH